jgi:hypothetical protein
MTIPSCQELLQAYFDRWEIEINYRDEKAILAGDVTLQEAKKK